MEWASPDAAPSDAGPAGPPSPPAPNAGAGRSGDGDRPPAPVGVGPHTVPGLLDGGFSIIKARPATVIGLAALVVVPVQLLVAYLQRDQLSGVGLLEVFEEGDTSLLVDEDEDVGFLPTVMALTAPSLSLPFVAAALTRLLAAWHTGTDLTTGAVARAVLRMTPALAVAWVLVHLVEGVGMVLLGFPALVAMTWFLVTAPVIAAEGVGPIAGMRRSAQLARRRFWPTLGRGLLIGAVATLFESAIGALPDLLVVLFGTDGLGWLLPGASGVLSSIFTVPFVAGATVLVYLDLRVRTEGLDLELMVADLR